MTSKDMEGILNETTATVHKHETGTSPLETICGASNNLSAEQLRQVPVTGAVDYDADRCGRCFDDAGGY